MPFRVAFLLLLLVLPASCGGGGATIEARDLARIMPSAADAPQGTVIDAESSGPKTIEEIAEDDQVGAKLRELGFRVGYTVSFATPNFDPAKETASGTVYGASGILLKDAAQADEGFSFYENRLQKRAVDVTPIVTSNLGEEAFAFRFSRLDTLPLPGLAYLWRVGNGLFSVFSVGRPDTNPNATRRMAELMDRNAKA